MDKQLLIESDLRSAILAGRLPPGTQLPNYDELQERYQVARATVLYAVRRIKEAGLVVSRGRNGLFVADRPPHLHRFALVFPTIYDEGNLFMRGILDAVPQVEANQGCSIELFTRVNGFASNESYRRLRDEHARGRIGGVVFISTPAEYLDSTDCPLMNDPGLPRIAFTGHPCLGATTYFQDIGAGVRLGARLLAEAGTTRLGILGWGWNDQLPDPRHLAMEAAPALRCDENWRLLVQGSQRFSLVRNLTCLLLARSPELRPDALLVIDDHLVDQVGLGMIDAGCAGQVRLMALGTLPSRVQAPVTASWIGWRPVEILGCALGDLAAARHGTPMPANRVFDPRPA